MVNSIGELFYISWHLLYRFTVAYLEQSIVYKNICQLVFTIELTFYFE